MKPFPADIADRAKIATATHFNVHLRRSPTEKINCEAPTRSPQKTHGIRPEDMIAATRAAMVKEGISGIHADVGVGQ